MKKCINCESNIRETDIFCRNCGCKVHKNSYYILINFAIVIISIGLLLLLALFIASYFIY